MGFESVHRTIDDRYDKVARILQAYGVQMSRERVAAHVDELRNAGADTKAVQRVLEGRKQCKRAVARAQKINPVKPLIYNHKSADHWFMSTSLRNFFGKLPILACVSGNFRYTGFFGGLR